MKNEQMYKKDFGKSKTDAILLVVIFGCWGWLYTARENWGNWLGFLALWTLGSFLVSVISVSAGSIYVLFVYWIILYIYPIINVSMESSLWYKNYYKN